MPTQAHLTRLYFAAAHTNVKTDTVLIQLDYVGEELDFTLGGDEANAKLKEIFGKKPQFADVLGLCKAATLKQIQAQGWSLNPGRYVGVAPGEEVSDEDFREHLETLNEELETLNAQARELEQTIARNVAEILEP
jgi:type I restriction enzyme M protein